MRSIVIHGRTLAHGGRVFFLLVVAALLAGCGTQSSTPPEPVESVALPGHFDAASAASITGRVTWNGDVPIAEEKTVRALAYNPFLHQKPARFKLPHYPKVNSTNRGLADAVIFLRGVDPQRSRAWDPAKVRVEFHERQLVVRQGESQSQFGFVRRGDAIEVINRDGEYHNLHGGGVAFFAMPLLDRDKVQERKLPKAGLVDLTCGAGYYWLHAHLFVVDHPYYARTNADGHFEIAGVLPGSYELVCWLPNWRVASEERDPETGVIARLNWASPVELTRTVRMDGTRLNVDLAVEKQMFPTAAP